MDLRGFTFVLYFSYITPQGIYRGPALISWKNICSTSVRRNAYITLSLYCCSIPAKVVSVRDASKCGQPLFFRQKALLRPHNQQRFPWIMSQIRGRDYVLFSVRGVCEWMAFARPTQKWPHVGERWFSKNWWKWIEPAGWLMMSLKHHIVKYCYLASAHDEE